MIRVLHFESVRFPFMTTPFFGSSLDLDLMAIPLQLHIRSSLLHLSFFLRDHSRLIAIPATDSFAVDRDFDELINTLIRRNIKAVLLSNSRAQESRLTLAAH